jgi:hypothetical protein
MDQKKAQEKNTLVRASQRARGPIGRPTTSVSHPVLNIGKRYSTAPHGNVRVRRLVGDSRRVILRREEDRTLTTFTSPPLNLSPLSHHISILSSRTHCRPHISACFSLIHKHRRSTRGDRRRPASMRRRSRSPSSTR